MKTKTKTIDLTKLTIWSRIRAHLPRSSRASLPRHILRAVIAAGGLHQAGPVVVRAEGCVSASEYSRLDLVALYSTGQAGLPERAGIHRMYVPRARRFSAAQRDTARAQHDPEFRRLLARRAAAETRLQAAAAIPSSTG